MLIVVWAVALAVAFAVHEGAHWTAARALGYPASFVLTFAGPGTRWGSDQMRSSFRDRALVAAAGPTGNLLLAAAAFAGGLRAVAIASLLVGVPQMLPVGPSDATNALRALRGREVAS